MYAARFLKILVNQIKVNEFVPFDMVISVSLPPPKFLSASCSSLYRCSGGGEGGGEKRTHVPGSNAFLKKDVLIDYYYELDLRN